MTTDPSPAPIRRYALCQPEGMRICEACIRNAHYAEPINPLQQFLTPTYRDGRCADWRAK